jgi:hypothetical protein
VRKKGLRRSNMGASPMRGGENSTGDEQVEAMAQ